MIRGALVAAILLFTPTAAAPRLTGWEIDCTCSPGTGPIVGISIPEPGAQTVEAW